MSIVKITKDKNILKVKMNKKQECFLDKLVICTLKIA